MSVVGNNRVGIPIVLLHDAEGSVISVETKKGEIIRGLLFEAEDMMNLYIKKAIITGPKPGAKRKVEQIYIRGTEITFIVLPEMLRHAPMFSKYCACCWQMICFCNTKICTHHVDMFNFNTNSHQLIFYSLDRIKHWRKHGGAPPEGVGAAVGQAAAILRKASERRGRGGFGGGGRGGFQQGGMGRGGPPQGGFNQGFGGRGPPQYGAPGQYGR